MLSRYWNLDGQKVHALQWGSNKPLLLAFHGYGQDAHFISLLADELQQYFIIISIDLPHHGKTEWAQGKDFSRAHLNELLKMVLNEFHQSSCTLLGYSMGGRVCLCILENHAPNISRAILVASDGLIKSPLYQFVTKNSWGKKVFKYATSPNSKILPLANSLYKLRLLPSHLLKFTQHYLGNEMEKERLYLRWPALKDLVPDRKKVRAQIVAHHIPVHLIFGKKDKIIPTSNGVAFKKNVAEISIQELNVGHNLIQKEFAHFFVHLIAPTV